MRKSTKYSPELRERAVRLVCEQRGAYESQWAAVVSIASKMGCTPQTLLTWVRQHERDTGLRTGVTTAEQDRMKALERENRELRYAVALFGSLQFKAQQQWQMARAKRFSLAYSNY